MQPISGSSTPARALNSQPASRRFRSSVWFIVLVAFVLRLAVILIGHTYRITPRRDHFQYGWEMGRLARSIALGQGFSSPTDLPTGPSAWAAPAYPYILAGVFKLCGIYTALSAFVILTFNTIFAALTCLTLYRIGEHMYGISVARGSAWTWAVFPYAIYWPTRVIWETSFTAFLLSLALLLTVRMADAPVRWRTWIIFGLLWGLIILTNTAVVSMMPFCLLWLIFGSWIGTRKPESSVFGWRSASALRTRPQSSRALAPEASRSPQATNRAQLARAILSVLVALLVATPWLIRNYEVFGKFIFIRDNLPLEMYEANNDRSQGLWTRNEHPGNDPQAMRRFQELGELRFMNEKRDQVHQFIHDHSTRFVEFTLERAAYFWIAPPQATIVAGYDLMISRHVNFALGAILAFAGLWLTLRNRVPGGFLLASFMLIYPLPYYLVNPFVRYKHPIEPEMVLLIVYLFCEARKVQIQWPRVK